MYDKTSVLIYEDILGLEHSVVYGGTVPPLFCIFYFIFNAILGML